jgi:hypothetical protein
MNEVDYSDRAITLRIHRLSQLRELCLSLGKAKRLSSPEGVERRKSDRQEPDSFVKPEQE